MNKLRVPELVDFAQTKKREYIAAQSTEDVDRMDAILCELREKGLEGAAEELEGLHQ